MTNEVKLSTGAVMKVYTPDGKQLPKLLEAFENGAKYICVGAEKFNSDSSEIVIKL